KIRGMKAQHANHAAQEANVNRFPLTRASTLQERGGDAQGAVQACNQVANGRSCSQGRAVLSTIEAHEPAHRLGDKIKGGPIPIRAAIPKPIDAAVNDIWSERFKPFGPKAHFLHYAGTVIL